MISFTPVHYREHVEAVLVRERSRQALMRTSVSVRLTNLSITLAIALRELPFDSSRQVGSEVRSEDNASATEGDHQPPLIAYTFPFQP